MIVYSKIRFGKVIVVNTESVKELFETPMIGDIGDGKINDSLLAKQIEGVTKDACVLRCAHAKIKLRKETEEEQKDRESKLRATNRDNKPYGAYYILCTGNKNNDVNKPLKHVNLKCPYFKPRNKK